jgi:site-specific recombinase XerD
MITTPIKTSFFIKKKTKRTDVSTVFFRMTHQDHSATISLKIDIKTADWDERKCHVHKSHPAHNQLSTLMDQMRRNALNLQQDMMLRGRALCVMHIKDRLTRAHSTSVNSDPTFLEVFDKAIDRKSLLKGQGNSPATIQKYKRCRAHLVNYLQAYYKRNDICFDQLNLAFMEDFELYMKTKGGCQHNSTMKYIQTLKTIFRVAKSRNITTSDPFLGFKISMRIVDRDFLNEEELQRIISTPLPTRYMESSRNMFLFACFTGLSYIDMKNLRVHHLVKENNRYWIRTKRQKSGVASNIPLLPIPLALIRKHHPDLTVADPSLPVIPVTSNQKTNRALKKIADHCNIKKELTFHIARHTFATTVTLSNGVPIESVSKMLGHKRIATTQHYAKIVDKKVEEDMRVLEGKLKFG